MRSTKKLAHRTFIERAIRTLRNEGYLGVHVVYSGFNQAFREYYGEDPRPVVDQLVEEGFLVRQLARGGVIISLASEVAQRRSLPKVRKSSEALEKILSGTPRQP